MDYVTLDLKRTCSPSYSANCSICQSWVLLFCSLLEMDRCVMEGGTGREGQKGAEVTYNPSLCYYSGLMHNDPEQGALTPASGESWGAQRSQSSSSICCSCTMRAQPRAQTPQFALWYHYYFTGPTTTTQHSHRVATAPPCRITGL